MTTIFSHPPPGPPPESLDIQQPLKRTLYVGRFIHCVSLTELEICEHGIIGVEVNGRIAFVERGVENDILIAKKHEWSDYKTLRAGEDRFFFPGFVDTHIHAPQYPNAGIFGNSTLLDWLETYTFPLEASFSDVDKARRIYSECVSRTIRHGTTTAAYYATTHVHSTNVLAGLCLEKGQRAFVGRCCMDSDVNPDYYQDESAEKAIEDTCASIEHIRQIDPEYTLIKPIVTPRYAPSCTSQLLKQLGELSDKENLPSQTHISENKSEIELVKKLFPNSKHYAGVYDDHGLLTPRMILAHAVHLTEEERQLIKKRGAKISHCPISNTALSSGLCPVRQLLDDGITVGLGTDVSGGYSPSILAAARHASLVSRTIAMTADDKAKLSVEEVLYLATRGGAKVIGLAEVIGAFEVGMQWDAQLVQLATVGQDGTADYDRPVDIFGWETWEERVAKWVFGGDDRNTRRVWVKGEMVHKK